MSKIGLIDVDGHNFPNIAQMKISAFHKKNGDDVLKYDMFSGHCDIVYKSKVFDFSNDYDFPIDSDVVVKGGTGYDLENILPEEIEHIYPDYSLYGIKDTAYGFLTRGCPRGCGFCIVGRKEGLKSVKVADLDEFWSGQKNIVLCDPNILACKERETLLVELARTGSTIDFNQGLDARMMTAEIAKLLSDIRIREIHFAWDRMSDGDKVLEGLRIYSENAKRKPHSHNAIVYVLCNFDTTFDQDLERIYTLRNMGYWAYVMLFDKQNAKKEYKMLQRWVNNRFIFAKCERFEDYKMRF